MILSRYITRDIVTSLAVVTLVLLAALLCQQLVRYLNFVAIGKVSTDVLLELVAYEIPYLLAFILPLGLFLGILLALGRLYANHEMIVMKMGGFDYKKLTRTVMTLAFFIFVIVLVLMMWVNPRISLERQRIMESADVTTHMIQTLVPGRFNVSPDGRFVMFVEALSRNKSQADNVFIAQEVSGKEEASLPTWRLVLAKSGYQTSATHQKTPFFVTTDGYRYEGVPGQNDYKIIQFKRYAISMAENKSEVLHPEVETLSFTQLLMNGAANEAAAEWQWRISVALSALMLACLALPLSASAPRQMNRYLVLLPALLFYLLYINLLFVARHWLEAGVVSRMIGMWWAHGVMLIFVLCAMSFLKSWRNQ